MSNKIEQLSKFILSRAAKGLRTSLEDLRTIDLGDIGSIGLEEFAAASSLAGNASFIPVDRDG